MFGKLKRELQLNRVVKNVSKSLSAELDEMTITDWSMRVVAHIIATKEMPENMFEEWDSLTESQKDQAFFNAWGIIYSMICDEDDNEVVRP